ncbi:MAG: tyrosine-type recombinase/integrase [Planctomycetota bacterium]|jgi:integrase
MSRSQFATIETKQGRPGHYLRFRYAGRRIRRWAGPTKAEAARKRAVLHLLASQNKPLHELLSVFDGTGDAERIDFATAAGRYLEAAKVDLKPSTWDVHRMRLDLIGRATWAGWLLSDILPKHIVRWLHQREAEGVSVATLNRYVCLVSNVFKWAILNEYVETNPAAAVPRYSEKGRHRTLVLTHKQVLHLLEVAPDDFRSVLVLAIFTGLRRGEIITLEWRDVALKAREITVRPENCKTSTGRTVPILDVVHDALRERSRQRDTADGSTPVLARPDGRPWTPVMFLWRWDRLMKAATNLPAEVRDELVLHSLRHCFASYLISAGQSLSVVAELMGHTVAATTARYAHLLPGTKKRAVKAVRKALGKLCRDVQGVQAEGRAEGQS